MLSPESLAALSSPAMPPVAPAQASPLDSPAEPTAKKPRKAGAAAAPVDQAGAIEAPAPAPPAPPALDLAALLAALLEGDPSAVPERLAALAAPYLGAEQRAAIEAKRTIAAADSAGETAAVDLVAAEQAFLSRQDDATHAQLEAVRSKVKQAADLGAIARRDLANRENALASARQRFALLLWQQAASGLEKNAFLTHGLAPHIERLFQLLQALQSEVEAVQARLQERRRLVALGYQLARLAGLDLRAMGQASGGSDVIDPHGGIRDASEEEALYRVRSQLTERAKEARIPLAVALWLTPWGV